MSRKNNSANPFLLQRQITQLVRSLSKEKKKALATAIIQIHNDIKEMDLDLFIRKYDL